MLFIGWIPQPRVDLWISRQTLHLNLGKLIVEVSIPQILTNGPPKKRTKQPRHGPAAESSRKAQDSRQGSTWASR